MTTEINDPTFTKGGESLWNSDRDFYDITWDGKTFQVALNLPQPSVNIIKQMPKWNVASGPYRWSEIAEEKQTGVATSVIVQNTGVAYAGNGTEGLILLLGVTEAETMRVVKHNVITAINPNTMATCNALVRGTVEDGVDSKIVVRLIEADPDDAFLKSVGDDAQDIQWFVSNDAQREYSEAPESQTSQPEKFENQTMISMASEEMSGSEMEKLIRTDAQEAQFRVKRMLERLRRGVARGLWHGVKATIPEGRWERNFSGGIRWALKNNELGNVNGVDAKPTRLINYETVSSINGDDVPWKGKSWNMGCIPFLDWIGEYLLASEDEMIDVVLGPGAFTMINQVLRASGWYEIKTRQSRFGFSVTEYIGFHRSFRLVRDPDFCKIKAYNYSAWFGELSVLRQCLVKNRNLHIVGGLSPDKDRAADNGFTFVDGKKVCAWMEHGYRWNNLKGMVWVDRLGFKNTAT